MGAGSLDSQFEAFEKVVAQHPTVWEPSVCTKSAFAKGVNWVRRNSRQMGGHAGTSHIYSQPTAVVVIYKAIQLQYRALEMSRGIFHGAYGDVHGAVCRIRKPSFRVSCYYRPQCALQVAHNPCTTL